MLRRLIVRFKIALRSFLVAIPPVWIALNRLRDATTRRLGLKAEAKRRTAQGTRVVARSLGRREQYLTAAKLYDQLGRLEHENGDDHQLRQAEALALGGRIEAAMAIYRPLLRRRNYDWQLALGICHGLAVHGYLDEVVEVYGHIIRRNRNQRRGLLPAGASIRVLPYYWIDRIGHIGFLDSHIKMCQLGWIEPMMTVLLAPAEKISNRPYLDLYRSYFMDVVSDPADIAALEPLVRIPEDIFFGAFVAKDGGASWWIREAWKAQLEWDAHGRAPLVRLSEGERKRGRQLLSFLGIPEDGWFVCIHARESAFHADKLDPSQTWRDSDIRDYVPAMLAIVSRGGWVIRMGDANQRRLPIDLPRVIDYAHSGLKSDWLDLYLASSCRFFIGTNSGLGVVPMTFGIPAIGVNYTPLANELYVKGGCFIPKLWWSTQKGRYLTFDELMTKPLGYTHSGVTFTGLVGHPNTPEEIRDIVVEMLDRLDGTFQYSEEDLALQARFDQIRRSHGVVSNAPIGRHFLRAFQALLDEKTAHLAPIHESAMQHLHREADGSALVSSVDSAAPRVITLQLEGARGTATQTQEEILISNNLTLAARFRGNLAQALDSLESAQAQTSELREKNVALEARLTEAREQAAQFAMERATLEARIAHLDGSASTAQAEIAQLRAIVSEFEDPNPLPDNASDPLVSPQSLRTKFIDGFVEGWGPAAPRVSPQLRARFPDIDDGDFWSIAHIALPHTALSVQRLYAIYLAVRYIVNNGIDGDVAECGVFKGGSAIMLARTLAHFGDTSRRIFLFDTFEGWPTPTDFDSDFLGQKHKELYRRDRERAEANQAAEPSVYRLQDFFERTSRAIIDNASYPSGKIIFVRGLVENTLPHADISRLAILRLDTDYYESTAWELKTLWSALAVHGVLLVDDYGQFHGARKAVDEFLAERKVPTMLHRDDCTGRSMIKLSE